MMSDVLRHEYPVQWLWRLLSLPRSSTTVRPSPVTKLGYRSAHPERPGRMRTAGFNTGWRLNR
jgi:hypothetical protein